MTSSPTPTRKHIIEPWDVTLVLAASIQPNRMADVSVVDPKQREADYLGALEYYLTQHASFPRIVLIENSGWPLDRFVELAQRVAPNTKFEPISLDLNSFPPAWGKSFGEMQLMERGIEQSKLVREGFYIAKLTGRLRLTNVTDMVRSIRRHFDLAIDLTDHPLYEWLRRPASGRRADTRFFLFRLRYWNKYVRGRLDELNEQQGEFVEDFFYREAKRVGTGEMIIKRLPIEPAWAGVAGHGNKDYAGGRERQKRFIRGAARRLLPWLKI